jgi:hypothetical protein
MDLCVCTSPATRQLNTPVPYKKFLSQPDGITKEQFGESLYDTIKTIGGILGIEQQRAAAIYAGHGWKIAGLMARRTALRKTLAEQLPKINSHDMDALLLRYPWIVSM